MHLSTNLYADRPADRIVAVARRRLAGRILDQAEDGLVPGTCMSRALESALTLRLFQLEGVRTPGCEALVDYLHWAARPAGRRDFEQLVARWALDGGGTDIAAVTGHLATVQHFSVGRKRILALSVAKLLGAAPELTVPKVDRRGLHPWASAYMTAAEVILQPECATPDQLTELRATQRGPGIWEEHILCHLLVLHALRLVPGHEDLVGRGITRLQVAQRADGGFPFIRNESIFVTALAGIGLADTSPRLTGRLLELADRIAKLQRLDGGWGYAVGVAQTDVDDTSLALEFLRAADSRRYQQEITAGLGFLRRIRGEDGGFPTYVPGAASEATMTAAAANAIRPGDPESTRTLRHALEFLAERQHADGTFEPGWSRSRANAICRAVLAMRHASHLDAPNVEALADRCNARCSRYLLDTQNPDGGWGQLPGEVSDPISSAFSVTALSHVDHDDLTHEALSRGAHYLVECQRSDGGFHSRPESVGPRPILFDVPILADVCTLLAFGHLETAGLRIPAAAAPGTGHP